MPVNLAVERYDGGWTDNARKVAVICFSGLSYLSDCVLISVLDLGG